MIQTIIMAGIGFGCLAVLGLIVFLGACAWALHGGKRG